PDTGRSYYDGVGKNHASITAKELENALFNAQAVYSPAAMLASAQRGQATHIEVKQDVRIEVNGAPDPTETARAVGREQKSVANEVIRYAGGLTG
ncbi:glucosaminidase, partial [Burkholderia gladioli]|nr:glucosaminidase [Burkholderia gladioli]